MLHIQILNSARKHDVNDHQIIHAMRNPFRQVLPEDDVVMLIGPDSAGNLMEVGYIVDDEVLYVIHAMQARRKFTQ